MPYGLCCTQPQERRRQERRDRRTLQNIWYEQSLRVRAGYVELHAGKPMSVEGAQLARDAWVKQRKQLNDQTKHEARRHATYQYREN